MFNDLMKEVNTKKKEQISGKNVGVNVQAQGTVKQTAKKEVDDVEDMLANL